MYRSIPMLILASLTMLGCIEGNEPPRGRDGNNKKQDYKHCACKPFGLFFQKAIPTTSTTVKEIPIIFDTTAFSTKDLFIDSSTGGIVVKKPGYYFLEYAVTIRNVEDENGSIPVDVFIRINNTPVLGSGAPTIIASSRYETLATSVKVKICDDCSRIFLRVLNPNLQPIQLVSPNIGIDVTAVLDIHYLGDLDCVCEPCEY